MRAKQSPSPPVGTFPCSLTSIFRAAPTFINASGAFTKGRDAKLNKVVGSRSHPCVYKGCCVYKGFYVIIRTTECYV